MIPPTFLKKIMLFFITNLEALSLGYIVIPNVIFMTYFIQWHRTPIAALPLILFYVALKTTPYAQRSFGRITNPYRILKNSLVITLIGGLVALYQPLIIEGAISIGIGLANVPAAYLQLKDQYRAQSKWSYSRAMIYSIFYLIAIIIIGMFLSKISLTLFFIELIIMLILGTLTVILMPSPWTNTPSFTGKFRCKSLIPTILIFSMTIGSRGLKQTGSTKLITFTLVIWLIMLGGFNSLQKRLNPSRLWTFWIGAVNNFFLIYSLFFFDVLGKFNLLYLAYILYILATITSLLLARLITSRSIILAGTILGLIITLIPSWITYLIGLTITCFFCSLINHFTWPRYQSDPSIPFTDKRFIKQNYNILGSIVSQITLICLFMITNFTFNHHTNQILAAYYQQKAITGLNWVLYNTRLYCILLIIIVLIIIIIKEIHTKLKP